MIAWVAGIAAVEIAVRAARAVRGRGRFFAAWPTPDPRLIAFESHPYALYVKRPDSRGAYPSTSLGHAGTREVAVRPPAQTVRIYCVGGSTTELHDPATGPDSSWPGRLQDLLAARFPDWRIEVINAGTAGYTSVESLVEFQLRGLDLQPDVLLVYHNVNDAWTAQMVEGFRPDYTHARRHKSWSLGWINRLPQLPWWATYQVARAWISHRFGKANALIYWISDPPWKTPRAFHPERVAVFKRNITNLTVLARYWNCVPVLIKWECDWSARRLPNYLERHDTAAEVYFEFLRANNDALREVADDVEGCRYVDVGPFTSEQFSDTVHFSAAGLEAMARRMAERLEPLVRDVIESRRAAAAADHVEQAVQETTSR